MSYLQNLSVVEGLGSACKWSRRHRWYAAALAALWTWSAVEIAPQVGKTMLA